MSDRDQSQLIRDASAVFLHLREAPDDPARLARRDQFLARGPQERAAYRKVLAAWEATETKPKSGPGIATVALALLLVGGGYGLFGPVRILLLADLRSAQAPIAAQLQSGDRVTLDAASALVDESDGAIRHVTLLQGAAFFDVVKDGRPFVVASGDMELEVLGTSFEVGRFDHGGLVSVAEGAVRVRIDARSWELHPGDRLAWAADGPVQQAEIAPDRVAGWREDLLLAEGLRLSEIAQMLERRLPGRVMIANAELGQRPILGVFDLSDPDGTLELLSQLTGARLLRLPGLGVILRP